MTKRSMDALFYAMKPTDFASQLVIAASSEEDARRMIGLLVVAGMVALVLKGFLIARWFARRKKRRLEKQTTK